jgi:hypothetical protein
MMDDDTRLAALFDRDEIADHGFSARVVALATLEDRLAARRHGQVRRIAGEALGLASILAAFAALARSAPVGDVVPLTSPAMIGLMLLGTWLAVGVRGVTRAG